MVHDEVALILPSEVSSLSQHECNFVGEADEVDKTTLGRKAIRPGSQGVRCQIRGDLQVCARGTCDGLKVDAQGNVWATGPGGVLVITPAGKHLGSILTNQLTGNCCWGDDGGTLYIAAHRFLIRVKTATKGAGWQ